LRNIPNILTILRIIAVPVFAWLVFRHTAEHSISIAFWLFVAASATDYLDGYLARKMNVVSNFGKIWDPLADKLLVLTALAGLTWSSPFRLHILIFIMIFSRELVITILREVYKKRGIIVAADKLGKLKTVMQMVGLIAAYAIWVWIAIPSTGIKSIIQVWFWIVTAITLYSGVNYFMIKRQ
jgi:CDP-diacylglycerol--glycerol-3-phosphate 3-phosphatidyltransferase